MINKKKKGNHKRKKKGYSLIEALVALGILLLGIVPVVTVATQTILFHHRASETEEAARISQTMIDYIKSRGYDELKLMVETTAFKNKYTISDTGEAFTVNDFGNASNFNISQNLILLDSKGINLNDVNFYIVLNKVKGDLKLYKTNTKKIEKITYTDPITGETNKNNVYREDLIYGEFIFGMGKVTTDPKKKTGREKELKTTFIMTPIENWK